MQGASARFAVSTVLRFQCVRGDGHGAVTQCLQGLATVLFAGFGHGAVSTVLRFQCVRGDGHGAMIQRMRCKTTLRRALLTTQQQ
jgi:hypothetical protein